MKVDRNGNDWVLTNDADEVLGKFGNSEAAWRAADRMSGEVLNPSQKRADYAFRKSVESSNFAGSSSLQSRRAPRNNEAWAWPDGLHPLREFLAGKGVDVTAVKTARQALFLAKQLGKVSGKMPKPSAEVFPLLVQIQRKLCALPDRAADRERPGGVGRKAEASAPSRVHGLGTFGPASEVRRIDPSTYKLGAKA